MHEINRENYHSAISAVKDILMMYVDLAQEASFSHNVDVHITFDPLVYVDSTVLGSDSYFVDMKLLHSGSAIAMLAVVYTAWVGEDDFDQYPIAARYKEALAQGRLAAFPDIEVLLEAAFAGQIDPPSWIGPDESKVSITTKRNYNEALFEKSTIFICQKYVIEYFRSLVK